MTLGVALIIVAALPAISHAAAPAGTVQAAPASSCAMNLDWSLAPLETGTRGSTSLYYKVSRSVVGSTAPASTFTVPAGASGRTGVVQNKTYTDTGLAPSTAYSYSVTGMSTGRVPGPVVVTSTPEIVTTNAFSYLVPQVANIVAAESGGNMVLTIGGGATLTPYGGYTLTRAIGSGAAQILYDAVASPISGSLLYSDFSFSKTAPNTYTVALFESDYGCAASRRATSSLATVVVPSTPTGLMATVSSSTPSVALAWTAGAAQTYAEVWRMVGLSTWTLLTPVSANTYVDTNVSPQATYLYKVRACANTAGNIGCSAFSTVASAAIPASAGTPPPAPPGGLQPPASPPVSGSLTTDARVVYTGASTTDVYISWNNANPAFSYDIEQQSTSTPTEFARVATAAASLDATKMSTTITVPTGSLYSFRVKAPGASAVSNVATVSAHYGARMRGTLWSQGTGWINISCETPRTDCAVRQYNVVVGADNELRGAGWSSANGEHGYGWFSFNKSDLVGCPDAATDSSKCVARLDASVTPMRIVGWARFLGAAGSGAGDGWVSLSGTVASRPLAMDESLWGRIRGAITGKADAQADNTYGLTYDPVTGNVRGKVWGGPVVGWIQSWDVTSDVSPDYDPHRGGDFGTPIVSNVRIEEGAMLNPARTGGTWCDDDPYYAIKWNFVSPGGAQQKQVKVTIYNASSGVPYVATTSTVYPRFNLFDSVNIIGKKKSFIVGVSAFDGVTWSAETMSSPTSTPAHYSPLVDFSWSPTPARTAWPMTMTGANTLDRSNGVDPRQSWKWSWTIPHATSTDPKKEIVTAKFDAATASSTDIVMLEVTDDTRVCGLGQQVIGNAGAQPRRIRDIRER